MFTLVDLDFTRVKELVSLEQESFTLAWGVREYLSFFIQDHAFGLGMLADKELIAFITCFYPPIEMEILNIAVKREYKRRKIGSVLINKAFARFENECGRPGPAFLEVRPSNKPALAFYSELGFEKAGVRKGYYEDNNEDAWIMRLEAYDRQKIRGTFFSCVE